MNENDLKNQDTEISAYRKALREIDWYLRSKRPVIYLTTPEELRIEEGISFICNRPDHKWDFITWDLVSGLKGTNRSTGTRAELQASAFNAGEGQRAGRRPLQTP